MRLKHYSVAATLYKQFIKKYISKVYRLLLLVFFLSQEKQKTNDMSLFEKNIHYIFRVKLWLYLCLHFKILK